LGDLLLLDGDVFSFLIELLFSGENSFFLGKLLFGGEDLRDDVGHLRGLPDSGLSGELLLDLFLVRLFEEDPCFLFSLQGDLLLRLVPILLVGDPLNDFLFLVGDLLDDLFLLIGDLLDDRFLCGDLLDDRLLVGDPLLDRLHRPLGNDDLLLLAALIWFSDVLLDLASFLLLPPSFLGGDELLDLAFLRISDAPFCLVGDD